METPVFRRKRYRFSYPSGLISLVLLPLIGIGYLYFKGYFTQQYALEINMPTPEWHKMNPEIFPPNLIPERKYLKLRLTGNIKNDELKLTEAQNEIRQIVTNRDIIKGVFIEFGPKAKYKSLVRLFNICTIEKAHKNLYYKNYFLVFETAEQKTEQTNVEEYAGPFLCVWYIKYKLL